MEASAKNILVLAASPRKDSNSAQLAREFCAAAQEKGCETTLFFLREHPISPCRACELCWSGGQPCVQKDGMADLYPLLEAADMVVLATPLYFFGFPAQLKAAIDRFYPYFQEDAKRDLSGKLCQMIVCGGSDNEDDYEAILSNYDLLSDYMKWEDYGVLLATGLMEAGAAKDSPWMENVRDLALDLGETEEEDEGDEEDELPVS